ncbi:diguanylate cyclase [bacterium]|nr:MAG: diguanylate cyclase [bacterium]
MDTLPVPLLPFLPLETGWDSPLLAGLPAVSLNHFRPEGSAHRPATEIRLYRSVAGLHGLFRVRDRYVRSVHTRFCDPVYEDSCVEFFFRPDISAGYFNFEFNAGGAMLAGFVTDHRRTGKGLRGFTPLSPEDAGKVGVKSSLPPTVFPEVQEPLHWTLAFFIPFEIVEKYVGKPLGGDNRWRGNFYKCGDRTSHPHWSSWMPLPEKNFHLPETFGELVFE